MATEAYTSEDIKLRDGTEVELRPLAVTNLRKFHRIWHSHISEVSKIIAEQEAAAGTENEKPEAEQLTAADINDKQFDAFIQMCALGLEDELKGDKTNKQFTEYLENTLDEPTIYRILDKTGNFKLAEDDPNLTPGP